MTVDLDHIPEHLVSSVDNLITQLDSSVQLQTQSIPQHRYVLSHVSADHGSYFNRSDTGKARVAVLFSGGIDSTMLAFLAHQ